MPSEFEVTRRILLARGVPESAIRVLPGEITSTSDEAQTVARLFETEPEARILVVTNSFHTRRARWAFRRALGTRADQISFVGVPRDGVDEETWWRSPHGCGVYLGEYAKLGYYCLPF